MKNNKICIFNIQVISLIYRLVGPFLPKYEITKASNFQFAIQTEDFGPIKQYCGALCSCWGKVLGKIMKASIYHNTAENSR